MQNFKLQYLTHIPKSGALTLKPTGVQAQRGWKASLCEAPQYRSIQSCPVPVQFCSASHILFWRVQKTWTEATEGRSSQPLSPSFCSSFYLLTAHCLLQSGLDFAATEKVGRCYPSYTDTGCDIPLHVENFPICKQTSLDWQLWHL